jgi:hypothetical protein
LPVISASCGNSQAKKRQNRKYLTNTMVYQNRKAGPSIMNHFWRHSEPFMGNLPVLIDP